MPYKLLIYTILQTKKIKRNKVGNKLVTIKTKEKEHKQVIFVKKRER